MEDTEKIREEALQLLKTAFANLADNGKYNNVEFEMITINVAAGTSTYNAAHVTAMRHKRIIGLALNITDEAVLEGSTFSLNIDGKEVFPAGTEAKLLFASTDVPPNMKFYTYVDREINQTNVQVSYTSNAFAAAYKAVFYLMCQNS